MRYHLGKHFWDLRWDGRSYYFYVITFQSTLQILSYSVLNEFNRHKSLHYFVLEQPFVNSLWMVGTEKLYIRAGPLTQKIIGAYVLWMHAFFSPMHFPQHSWKVENNISLHHVVAGETVMYRGYATWLGVILLLRGKAETDTLYVQVQTAWCSAAHDTVFK